MASNYSLKHLTVHKTSLTIVTKYILTRVCHVAKVNQITLLPNQIHPNSTQIHKGTRPVIDSYSAFFDNKKLGHTELEEVLRRQNITDVFVCGIALDVCVGECCTYQPAPNTKAEVLTFKEGIVFYPLPSPPQSPCTHVMRLFEGFTDRTKNFCSKD